MAFQNNLVFKKIQANENLLLMTGGHASSCIDCKKVCDVWYVISPRYLSVIAINYIELFSLTVFRFP